MSDSDQGHQVPRAGIKLMKLRYAGVCGCGQEVAAGVRAGWDRDAKAVICEACLAGPATSTAEVVEMPVAEVPAIQDGPQAVEESVEPVVGTGEAGASLQREHDRRSGKREDRIRARFPRAGGFILAVTDDPQTTRAFKSGAEGERKAAAKITESCGSDVLFLLNRKLSRTRRDGDIDMIAISPAGIHVIDVKRYKGAKVEVRRSGGLFSKATEQLYIGGRDRTGLLASMTKQIDAVRAALSDFAGGDDISVTASMCFVDADLPVFSTPRIAGIAMMSPKETAKMLQSGEALLDDGARATLHAHLADLLPPAA